LRQPFTTVSFSAPNPATIAGNAPETTASLPVSEPLSAIARRTLVQCSQTFVYSADSSLEERIAANGFIACVLMSSVADRSNPTLFQNHAKQALTVLIDNRNNNTNIAIVIHQLDNKIM